MSDKDNEKTMKNESESRTFLEQWATEFSLAPASTFEKITGFLDTIERYDRYNDEQVVEIIRGNNVASKRDLSNYFYETNNLYKNIVNYMASYYLYYHRMEYHPTGGFIEKEYVNGLATMDNLNIKNYSYNMMLSAIRDGIFFGVVNFDTDEGFAIIKLPPRWCTTAGVDRQGLKNFKIDLREIENSLRNQNSGNLLEQIKKSFPKQIYKDWRKYQRDKTEENRFSIVTGDIGIMLNLYEGSTPPLLNLVEDIRAYAKTKTIEYLTALDELRKIVVQKFPLNKEDEPVLSTPEMKEYHRLVGSMLQKNPYIDLITTIAEVDKIQMQDANRVQDSKIAKTKESIYDSVGLPHMLFSPSGNTSLKQAIAKDGAVLADGINYLSKWFSFQMNIMYEIWFKKKKKGNFFEVSILSISHYNRDDFIQKSLEMAKSGYDVMTPGIAMGQTHRQVYSSIIVNDALRLVDKMRPLRTSYTTSGEGGADEKDDKEKDDKTIENLNGETEV